MATIVVTEFMDEAAVASLVARYPTLYIPDLVDRQDDLHAALKDARALIVRNRTQVSASLLAGAPALEVVGRLGVGLDNIDLTACRGNNIMVRPATGANDGSVAEYVVCAAMLLRRHAFYLTGPVLAGSWPRNKAIGHELSGARAGLIGFGSTARATALRLQALGMQIAAYDPHLPADDVAWHSIERLPLHQLLAWSDIISLHVPLNDATHNLINAQTLALMKHDAVLINASRGGIVEHHALVEALREHRLAGAALDVFPVEPLSAAEAAIFKDVPNLILTPHIAGVTEESNVRVSAYIADVILRDLARK